MILAGAAADASCASRRCGLPFRRPRGSHQRYCSPRCRGLEECSRKTDRRLRDGACAVCGAPFSTTQRKRVYCSKRCALRAFYARGRPSRAKAAA